MQPPTRATIGPRPEPEPLTDETIRRYLRNISEERDGAFLYATMAAHEPDPSTAELYQRLGDTEARHAGFWERHLARAGVIVPPFKPSWRARMLAFLARRFGAGLVLPIVSVGELRSYDVYDRQPETAGQGMRSDERGHARALRYLVAGSPQGVAGETLGQLEGRHRQVGGNALRAAVLGANDGLTSNLSLVMGVAGADLAGRATLVTGLTGLVAGALSMAIGEWVSVQSTRESFDRQISIESDELADHPEEEREELRLIYEAKGIPRDEAASLASHLMRDPDKALDALAREELGLDPAGLGGSPTTAALTSLTMFAVGALVPLVPLFFATGTVATIASVAAAGLGLFAIGAGVTLFTGRSIRHTGTRQLVFGLAAALVTFGLGRLVGVAIG